MTPTECHVYTQGSYVGFKVQGSYFFSFHGFKNSLPLTFLYPRPQKNYRRWPLSAWGSGLHIRLVQFQRGAGKTRIGVAAQMGVPSSCDCAAQQRIHKKRNPIQCLRGLELGLLLLVSDRVVVDELPN